MRRKVLRRARKEGTQYFNREKSVKFFSSGCMLLDCVLGGGWALGKVVNLVGDKSTGKTGLTCEAGQNFLQRFPGGKVYHQEAESAFDKDYAFSLGLPRETEFLEFAETVEEMFVNLDRIAKGVKPKLFILDSLDALSDKREQSKEIGQADYNTGKATQMSQLFRKMRGKLSRSNTTFMVVSQVRSKIGVTFGKKQIRAGGHALDFYASQALWLAEIKKIPKKVRGVSRSVGIQIKAKCEKNKVARPYRECQFPYIFEYGIDDESAHEAFLKEMKVNLNQDLSREELNVLVFDTWEDIEKDFTPGRKYK